MPSQDIVDIRAVDPQLRYSRPFWDAVSYTHLTLPTIYSV